MYRYKSNATRVSVGRWLLARGVLLWGGASAGEQCPLTWPTGQAGQIEMNGRFAVLLDPHRALAAEAVVAGRHDGEFVRATRDNTNPGFTDADVWARFSIHYQVADRAGGRLVGAAVESAARSRDADCSGQR